MNSRFFPGRLVPSLQLWGARALQQFGDTQEQIRDRRESLAFNLTAGQTARNSAGKLSGIVLSLPREELCIGLGPKSRDTLEKTTAGADGGFLALVSIGCVMELRLNVRRLSPSAGDRTLGDRQDEAED